jgi:DNA topoisomerase I
MSNLRLQPCACTRHVLRMHPTLRVAFQARMRDNRGMTTEHVKMRPASDAERKALGIPPAYTNVYVAVDPEADLIATAKTPKGKTFYRYSKRFVERQTARKWKRVQALEGKLQKIEDKLERDAHAGNGIALCARLILHSGMRNGGEPQGDKPSFGASSLLMEHVVVTGSRCDFRFPGKHGVEQDVQVDDAMLARYVRSRKGELKLFDHDAAQTLRYMKSIGAAKVHDLRTLRANMLARALVEELVRLSGKPETKRERKALVKIVAERVGAALGNKPGQALKSYINPRVFDAFGEEE